MVKGKNIIQDKTFNFAIRVVKAYQLLSNEKREFILSKQFLRSWTSIGANVEEAIGAQSKADFIAKLSISYKEARKTNYWIRLMQKTGYFSEKEAQSLLDDLDEILRIIAQIKLTSKVNS